jgi:hypothetical protein
MTTQLDNRVKLTAKQEQFCQNIAIEHMTQHDAYIQAYDIGNCSDATIDVNASKLAADTKISLRIEQLEQSILSPKIANKRRIAERLTHVLESDSNINGTPVFTHIVQSAAELNKMQGNYAKTDNGNTQTIINIIVPDKETKNLLSNVEDNTRVIETGYKLLSEPSPDAPEST